MTERYRTKPGWRIFILITAPLLVGLFVFLLVSLVAGAATHPILLLFLGAVCVAMIGLMLYGIADVIVGYHEIGDDYIAQRTVLGKKVVPLSDIKGASLNEQHLVLMPKSGKKSMKISKYVQSFDDITLWAYDNFEDLDTQKAEEEDIEVLKEITQDVPAAEHNERLKRATVASRYLAWGGYGIGLITLFYPGLSYDVLVVASMLMPIIIMIAIWRFKGFLRYNGQEKSRYPAVTSALLTPIVAVCLRALLDFDILDYENLWAEAGAIAIGLLVAAMWSSNELSFKNLVSGFTLVFFAAAFYAYAISSMIIVNCRFDSSGYDEYEAVILNKEISGNKTTTYYLDLTPWGPRTEHGKVSVTENTYNRVNVGNTVEVYLYDGRLKAKWFEVVVQ